MLDMQCMRREVSFISSLKRGICKALEEDTKEPVHIKDENNKENLSRSTQLQLSHRLMYKPQ